MAKSDSGLVPNLSISDEQWIERKRTYTRKQFIERYAFPVLLMLGDDKEVEFEFRTQVSPGPQRPQPQVAPRILPLVKSEANPYRDRIIVGRTRNCDVMIRTADISKYHADFRLEGTDRALLRDRRSSNGTMVGDEIVQPDEPVMVESGDTIRFGSTPLLFLGPGQLFDLL